VPVHIDRDAAARPDAAYRPTWPGRGEDREEADGSIPGLDDHFNNACSTPKIAVDLKWWVSIEQIAIAPLRAQQQFEHRVSVFAFTEPRPQIEAPGDGPAGCFIAPKLQRASSGGGQVRRLVQRDLMAGIKAIEVGHVAVIHFRCAEVPVVQPFLQLPAAAHLVTR
jgi:hypothetical protein